MFLPRWRHGMVPTTACFEMASKTWHKIEAQISDWSGWLSATTEPWHLLNSVTTNSFQTCVFYSTVTWHPMAPSRHGQCGQWRWTTPTPPCDATSPRRPHPHPPNDAAKTSASMQSSACAQSLSHSLSVHSEHLPPPSSSCLCPSCHCRHRRHLCFATATATAPPPCPPQGRQCPQKKNFAEETFCLFPATLLQGGLIFSSACIITSS